MSVKKLSSASDAVVQAMNWKNPQFEGFIRGTISQYTLPRTFADYFSYLVYRVKNAFAAIVGNSDWQVAKKLLKDRIDKALEESKVINEIFNANPEYKKMMLNEFAKTNKRHAEVLLSYALAANGKALTEGFKKSVEKLSVDYTVVTTENNLQKLALERLKKTG